MLELRTYRYNVFLFLPFGSSTTLGTDKNVRVKIASIRKKNFEDRNMEGLITTYFRLKKTGNCLKIVKHDL